MSTPSGNEDTSHDTIRKVVKEGLEARNLLNFISDGSVEGTSKKPPRPQSVSPRPLVMDSNKGTDTRLLVRSSKRRCALSRPKSRWRSASAGRNPEKDLRARYWTFLFENLHRAVDEIYQTCEMDESIVESKEAIMMLENYSKEFHALIQYININKDYEKTAPPNRPTSLAWEVRKSSPGKSLLKNVFIEKLTTGNSNAKRILCFDNPSEFASPTEVKSASQDQDTRDGSIPIRSDTKPRMNVVLEASSQNEETLKSHCDITISVVSASADEIFPCNDNLVVNQVRCQNNGSIIAEASEKTDDKSLQETLVHEECLHTSIALDAQKPVCGDSNDAVQVPKGNSPIEVKSLLNSSETNEAASNGSSSNGDVVSDTEGIAFVKKSLVSCEHHELLSDSSAQDALDCTDYSSQESTSSPSTDPALALTGQSLALSSDSPSGQRKSSKGITLSDSSSQTVYSEPLVSSNKNHLSSQCMQCPDVSSEALNSKKQEAKKNEKNSRLSASILSKQPSMPTVEKKMNPRMKPLNKSINKAAIAPSASKPSRPIASDAKVVPKPETTPPTIIHKTTPKEVNENHTTVASQTDLNCRTLPTKPSTNSVKSATTEGNLRFQKNLDSGSTITVPKLKFMRRSMIKPTTPTEEKKISKMSYSESAIKRNISYVSSLSSKNQQEKLETSMKKPTSRIAAERMKLSQKNGSMPSLNKPSSARSLARKTASVEKIPEILKSNTDDDSDGWETVRGRNRCRNSPAKKIPFTKQNQENQAIQFAKLNQSRIGGFPYTTKVNGKVVTKNTQKAADASKKSSNLGGKTDKTTHLKSKAEIGSHNELHASGSMKGSALNSSGSDSVSEEHLGTNESKKSESSNGNQLLYENSSDYLEYGNANERSLRTEFLRLPQELISALETNKFPDIFNPKNVRRSLSAPVQSGHETNLYTLSKTLCISDLYLGTHKYASINTFKKKLFDKCVSSTKRRAKKAKALESSSVEKNALNGSLDESDNGLTSDDQDGPMSHDEAFDVQCQELYDTAWKYKILEQQVHKLELSWGEQMDRFDMELRTPGRALEMHEKLSSPFRKKSLFESIRVCNEKQLKAQEQRERLLVEKAQKFKIIQKKRQEMKSLLEQRQEKQRILMEQKLQRAEEKRKKQLQMIIRKAHDEEEKVNEIAFINSLEAQNKRHDLISKEKDHEARLHDIHEERQRRQEEKAAKEAAAEGRRKILEAERQARLTEMQEKRKIRDHKVEQLFLVKEKERQELASQKARDRELRLSALNAQQQITIEELQKKIQLKQEESARRHEENMEQIRQKAFELSIRKCSSNNDDVPQPVPYERKKICTICNVLIGSEVYLLSHLHGKKHQEAVKVQYQGQDPSAEELELYNLKHIVDASTDQLDPNIAFDKERQKALKKRCKKLRQRMSNRGQEYEAQTMKAESLSSTMKANFHRMEKVISDIKKLSVAVEEGSNDTNLLPSLERNLNEIISMYQKKLHQDKAAFKMIGGVNGLINLFGIISNPQLESTAYVYKKILIHLSSTAEAIVDNSYDLCNFILFSNKIGNLLDFLIQRLNNLIPDNISQLMINQGKSGESNIPLDLTSGRLLRFLTNIFISLTDKNKMSNLDKGNEKENKSTDFHYRVQDLISYIVSIGIVDKLSQFFHCIQGPINNEVEVAAFLLDGIAFVTALIKLNSNCFSSTTNRKMEDSTQLIATFRVTNAVGAVSLLYGLLLHSGASSRGEEPPPPLPKQIEILAFSTLCMLNHMAVMSLPAFQSILGSEGLSLQLRHITSHLLWYCSHLTSEALLHEIILLIGYFTVLNPENQSIIQAGQRPTVLQQLCCLPFLYFSDTELTDILFPTLISCCYNNPANKTILQQEMTSELLSNYIEVKYLNGEENNLKDGKSSIHSKRWIFSVRFPKCHWSSAKHDFSAV